MGRGLSIAGRKMDDGIDFYQTPAWATEKLLEKESFQGGIYEPCSGAGAMSRVLEQHGYQVASSDIRTDDSVYGQKGVNLLEACDQARVDNIVTNPPYKYAQAIIEKSLAMTDKKVAMLLKLSFLESERRYEFFQAHPPKHIYVFCKRITMYPEGTPPPKNSGTIAYAWYVWEKGYQGKPTIDWLL